MAHEAFPVGVNPCHVSSQGGRTFRKFPANLGNLYLWMVEFLKFWILRSHSYLAFRFRIGIVSDHVSVEGLLVCKPFWALGTFPFLQWVKVHLDFVVANQYIESKLSLGRNVLDLPKSKSRTWSCPTLFYNQLHSSCKSEWCIFWKVGWFLDLISLRM